MRTYVERLKRALQAAVRRGDTAAQAVIRAQLDAATRKETR